MAFRIPLTEAQYIKLHGSATINPTWAGDMYLDFDPCTVIFAARVNGALSADTPFASITYDTVTTGAYTDIVKDQVVIVSPTNDKRDINALRLRVRKTPTSSILYINEISYSIADNAYIWVLNTYDPIDKLAKPLSTTVQVKDYELTYTTLPPTARGLQAAYGGKVGATGKKRLYFNLTVDIGESGSSISAWAFTFTAATYTVIAGALTGSGTTVYLVVDITPGWQWAKFTATDNHGEILTRHFIVAPHDDSIYPVSTVAFPGAQVSNTVDQGWTATFDAFSGVSDVLPGTCGFLWTEAWYNGKRTSMTGEVRATITNKALTSNVVTITTSAAHYFQVGDVVGISSISSPFVGNFVIVSVPTSTTFTYACTAANVVSVAASGTACIYTNDVDMVGWLEGETQSTENDPEHGIIPQVQFRLSGIAARIAEVEAQLLAVRLASTADEWDEIVDLSPWRAVIHYLHRHTTVLNLCDWFDDDRSTTFEFQYVTPQGTNILETIRGIASSINAHIEFGPTGEIQMVRDTRFRNSAYRASLTPTAAFTEDDLLNINSYDFDHWDKVGKVDFAGAFYNASSGNAQAFRARAPGYAQGSGAGSTSLENQILQVGFDANTAIDELRQRVGDQLSIENKTRKMGLRLFDGYCFGVASYGDSYTWALDTTYNNRNLTLDTTIVWLLEGMSYSHSNDTCTRDVDWNYTLLTPIGDKGDNIPPIDEGEEPTFEFPPFDFPDIPAPEAGWLPAEVPPGALNPPGGQIAPYDGNTALWWNDDGTGLWITRTLTKLRSPKWKNITPVLATGFTIKQAVFDPFYSSTAVPVYVLASDGTDSKIYYTENALSGDLTWSAGASFAGIYAEITPSSAQGSILFYAPYEAGAVLETLTVPFTSGTPTPTSFNSVLGQTYTAIVSGVGRWIGATSYSPYGVCDAFYLSDYADSPVFANVVYYTCNGTNDINLLVDGVDVSPFPAFQADHIYILTLTGTGSPFGFVYCDGLYADNTGSMTIKVYGSGAAAKVRSSSDYGATVSSAVTVGATPGRIGGLDVQYIGSVNYASMAGKVRKAATLGGAYSNHTTYSGNPVCILVPWSTRNSTTIDNLNIASPDYLVAEDAGKLWWVTGAASKTDITPPGVTSFSSANCITTWLGTYIRVIGLVSGVAHVFTSTNGGASWTDRGAVSGASFIRGRKKQRSSADTTAKNMLFIAGASPLKVSTTAGANLYDRTKPGSSGAGIDILG